MLSKGKQALTIILVAGLVHQLPAQDSDGAQPAPADQLAPASVAESPENPAPGPEAGATPAAEPLPARAETGTAASTREPGSAEAVLPVPDVDQSAPALEPGADDAGSQDRPEGGIRTATHERLLALLEEQRYTEAVPVAEAVVTLTEREYGPNSLQMAAPIDNLATTQMLKGDLIAAEQSYRRSIAIVEQHEGALSGRLVNSYVGLGSTYNRAGLYDKAEEAFSTALRLNNVNEGFYNLEQMKIRDGLTETYVGLEKIEEADFQQYVQLQIYQRRLGEGNPETAPAMYKLARWYERSNQPEQARLMYQRAQAMIRKAYGRKSIQMVAAYEGLADSYERQGDVAGSASYLKKALSIVEEQPEVDRPRQAELLIRLGELYGMTGRYDTANAYYERGWQALTLDVGDEFAELRAELFDDPVRVTGLGLKNLRYAPGSSADWSLLRDGYVLVRYDVDERGRVEDLVVVESDPAGVMDDRVSSALKRSYFRPRLADGTTVVAEGVLYRHEFYYQPEDPGRSEDAGEPLEPPQDSGRLEYPGSSG